VSPLCASYDSITGKCLTCVKSDYTVDSNGACLQISSPLAGCAERERLGFGKCVGANENCKLFNLITLDCITCADGYYIDYRGVCAVKPTCSSNQWNANNICLVFPDNCVAVDELGLCTRCSSADFRLRHLHHLQNCRHQPSKRHMLPLRTDFQWCSMC